MSWTPDVPTGFDPCGIAFGAVRKPYSAKCNFFADSLAGPNRINWYIVPDGSPIYDGITPFWPRVDVPPDQALTVYEAEGQGRYVRKFDWGLVFIPPPPHGVDGDAQDFGGNSPSNKYVVDGTPPASPCPVIRQHQAGVTFGAKPLRFVPTGTGGVQFGARIVLLPVVIADAGVRFGAAVILLPPRYTAGVRFGGKPIYPTPSLQGGIQFGASVSVNASALVCKGGLQFNGVDIDLVVRGGIQFGGNVYGVPVLDIGVQWGAAPIQPNPVATAGAQFGGDVLPPPWPAPTAGVRWGGKVTTQDYALTGAVQFGAAIWRKDYSDGGFKVGASHSRPVDVEQGGVQLGGQLNAPSVTHTGGIQFGGSVHS